MNLFFNRGFLTIYHLAFTAEVDVESNLLACVGVVLLDSLCVNSISRFLPIPLIFNPQTFEQVAFSAENGVEESSPCR